MSDTSKPTVRPVGRVDLGRPQPCPTCGGRLGPAFGMRLASNGRRYPVVDPTFAYCTDCGELFTVAEDPEP
jgi:hypothetical protein